MSELRLGHHFFTVFKVRLSRRVPCT